MGPRSKEEKRRQAEMEAEIGVLSLQGTDAKDAVATRSWGVGGHVKQILLPSFQKESVLVTLSLQTSGFQNCERSNVCCSKTPRRGNL